MADLVKKYPLVLRAVDAGQGKTRYTIGELGPGEYLATTVVVQATAPSNVEKGDAWLDPAGVLRIYDGAAWAKISSGSTDAGWITIAGTANSLEGTTKSPPITLTDGVMLQFTPVSSNTGSTNIDVDGLGIHAIVDNVGLPLAGYELVPGRIATIVYSNSMWHLLNPVNQAPGFLHENDQVVQANYTLTTGKNAVSAGPITIPTGMAVTVPNGAVWSTV